MKRVISFIVTALLAVNVVCAKGFFSNRFFELRVDVPVNLSNNTFSLNDIMVKDLIIDLRKIADTVPKNGFTTIIELNPSISTKLRIMGVSVGTKVGANAYVKLNISKDLFDFLGYGYKAGDTLNVNLNPVVDLFAYAEVPVSFKVNRFKLSVTPSLFMPIATMNNCKAVASVYNTVDGKVGAKVDADLNIYTSAIYDAISGTGSMDSVNFGDYMGFDLAGSFQMPFFFEDLDLRVDARIPIVPGKLDRNVNVKYSYAFEQKISDLVMPPESSTEGTEPKPAEPTTPAPSEPQIGKPTVLSEPFYINRPMKINAYAVYEPFGFITLIGGGGCGIRHPFGDGFYMYPEYYFSATVSLIDILKATVSTEYTDQMFRHEFTGVFNLRFFELDVGVSLQSAEFAQSFNMAGFGAKVGVVLGF